MSESVTLKEHFESILSEKDKALSAALASAEKAVLKKEEEVERWRSNANEWRGAMSDRERDFLTRKEFYAIVGTAVGVMGAVFALMS
jgi:hypothetical protein